MQTSALALAGNALTTNIYLDIPPIVHGLQSCFLSAGANPMGVTLQERRPDPQDLSSIVEQYSHAWWTHSAKWETMKHELLDIDVAFDFHTDKVSAVPCQSFCFSDGIYS